MPLPIEGQTISSSLAFYDRAVAHAFCPIQNASDAKCKLKLSLQNAFDAKCELAILIVYQLS